MKKHILILFTVSISVILFFGFNSKKIIKERPKYVLVVHCGAGSFHKDIPDSIKNELTDALNEALLIGENILKNGGSSLDAVEKVVRYLEDNPLFNAGKGAVLTDEGKAELDASIMNGKNLSCGAVASVRTVKNPISLARLVMEKTKHVLLVADGAEKFADEMKVDRVPNDYFIVPNSYQIWLKQIQNKKILPEKKGTVGAAALDLKGNLAAATSTGGMGNKKSGRVGDSPIIGAGTYANNKTCAVSCTGWGEKFIKNSVAFNINALMLYKNFTVQNAVQEILYNVLEPGDGGIIAVDKKGNYVMDFSTDSMLRGVVTSFGVKEIKIWK